MYLNIEMVTWVLVTFLQILYKFPNESVGEMGILAILSNV